MKFVFFKGLGATVLYSRGVCTSYSLEVFVYR
jgi:hypothetical protein